MTIMTINLASQLNSQWIEMLKRVIRFYVDLWNQNVPTDLDDTKLSETLETISLKNYQSSKTQEQISFLILSGPSGVGKGTIALRLEKKGIKRLIRDTTKKPTPSDQGKYNFISREEFLARKNAELYIGANETYGEWRGVPKDSFLSFVKAKTCFYIEGSARTSRDFLENPDPEIRKIKFLNVFLLPPSFEELFNRLSGRTQQEKIGGKSISDEEVIKRMQEAINHLKKASHAVENRPVVDIFLNNQKEDGTANKIINLFRLRTK